MSYLKSLQKRKEELEEQIGHLENMRSQCNQQFKGEGDADKRSQLRIKIDNYSTDIDEAYKDAEEIDKKINSVSSRSSNFSLDNTKNQQQLNIDESLCNVDFKEASETFRIIQSQFSQNGDVALFFMEDNLKKKGDLYLQRLKSELKPKTSYRNHFRHFPITYKTGNLAAVAQEIANFLKIKQENINVDEDEDIKLLITEICDSLQRNSILFIEINCDIDDENDIDPLILWFINKFWKPLRAEIQNIAKKYTGIKVFTVISSNLEIHKRFLTESLSPYYNHDCRCFKWDRLVKIPLQNWTVDDIKNWLIVHSHPSYEDKFIERKANRIFNESSGTPRLAYDALQQQWKTLTCPNNNQL